MKGRRRQGGQRKRWEDNIREWTGLEFGKSQRAVENREKWRKLVAKSFVVPQRPSRLRDWWWWWISIYTLLSAAFWSSLVDHCLLTRYRVSNSAEAVCKTGLTPWCRWLTIVALQGEGGNPRSRVRERGDSKLSARLRVTLGITESDRLRFRPFLLCHWLWRTKSLVW